MLALCKHKHDPCNYMLAVRYRRFQPAQRSHSVRGLGARAANRLRALLRRLFCL